MDLPTVKSVVWMLVRVGLGAYFGLCLLLYFRQGSMVYYPTREITLSPGDIGLAYEDLIFFTEDGERISGWYVPAPERKGTILAFHGNGGNIGHRLHLIGLLRSLGWDVCIIDYRGYGSSTGRPTEEGTYQDARAAWNYLVKERGLRPDRIVIHGRSLGGAVAAALAAEVNPAGLILESTFTSVPDLGHKLYPYLPVRWLCRFKYDTLARLSGISCPLLVAHSRDDDMIPFRHGERLFAAAREPKTFVPLEGGHNDGEDHTAPSYRAALIQFLDPCVPQPAVLPAGPVKADSLGESR
jgi:fermentation-respiration switch protein FrsA (DUF1100 family)